MKSTVAKDQNTMTGMVNKTPKTVGAPNLSGMNKLFERKVELLVSKLFDDERFPNLIII